MKPGFIKKMLNVKVNRLKTVWERGKTLSTIFETFLLRCFERELILDAKKRKSNPEEFQKSAKRLAAHDYTPATYEFNDFSGL
eukprot:COSAG02_NODE_2022_length_10084_cov_2.725643_4_plen_83_part_00